MGFTVVTAPSIDTAAYTPVAADGSNGNKYENNGRMRLIVLQGAPAQEVTITINVPTSTDNLVDDNVVADKVIVAPASLDPYEIKALDPAIYNQKASDGTAEDVGFVTFMPSGTLTNVEFMLSEHGV